jgi:hypothetical protein
MGKERSAFLEDFSGAAAIKALRGLDTATKLCECKSFATLAAHFAMQGCELIKDDSIGDGQSPYYAAHWKLGVQPLASLDAANDYLAQMLGAGDGAR